MPPEVRESIPTAFEPSSESPEYPEPQGQPHQDEGSSNQQDDGYNRTRVTVAMEQILFGFAPRVSTVSMTSGTQELVEPELERDLLSDSTGQDDCREDFNVEGDYQDIKEVFAVKESIWPRGLGALAGSVGAVGLGLVSDGIEAQKLNGGWMDTSRAC